MTVATFHPTPTPIIAAEYVRISKAPGGLKVERATARRTETIATVCGGMIGRAIAVEAAKIAASIGMINALYLDEDV